MTLVLASITLIPGARAQQNIPDEFNFQPFYQPYLNAKAVSDQKRADANQAQAGLSAAQRQLQDIVDQLANNANTIRQEQAESDQLYLNNQSLISQNATNDYNIKQNQLQLESCNNIVTLQYVTIFNNTMTILVLLQYQNNIA